MGGCDLAKDGGNGNGEASVWTGANEVVLELKVVAFSDLPVLRDRLVDRLLCAAEC